MPFSDTVILATAWLNQPRLGTRPARTLLVGAATLTVRHRFGAWSFDLQSHSTTVTDNPAETMLWLAEDLWAPPAQLLLWRAEDIVTPSLIAAATTAHDSVAAVKLLQKLGHAFAGEVIDVAAAYGGVNATSFDEIAHAHGVSFVAMTRDDLAAAHRTGNHGTIRDHLAARAKAMWRLWVLDQPDVAGLKATTAAWIAEQEAQR